MKSNGLQEAVKTLVLTRKVGESIDVGGIIRFTLAAKGKVIIQAPEDIRIIRTELADRDRRESAA